MLSLMVAKARPDLVRCVVMLDAPVVAGWRALFWRLVKLTPLADKYSPAAFSAKRRMVWPDAEAAYQHFASKDIFAAWAPGVLRDYINSGLKPHPDGVQLRFTREIETKVYRTLPHHLGRLMKDRYPVPIGFIGGADSWAEKAQKAMEQMVKDEVIYGGSVSYRYKSHDVQVLADIDICVDIILDSFSVMHC
jgi:pimeloyl-ACP methyl ester carboxylesterase